eukprot:scaffold21815_cov119-Isochrysis_galbana.AAC.1
MAPRQLILPPMEDDLHPEPGSKRVRPSSDEKSSMQVQLRASASACGTPWPGPAHWLALLALPWANGQSLPLLAREECAAKNLLSVAATPFATTASAVYYNPLRRTKWRWRKPRMRHAGAQSHLCRALIGCSGRPDSLRVRLRVQVALLRRHEELSGPHRSFNRVSGILALGKKKLRERVESFKTSPESTQTTHLKPNRERFSEAVPSHCPLVRLHANSNFPCPQHKNI